MPSQEIAQGTRGPEDDFFCHKYEVWYRTQDCVYRGRNKTYAGCVNCFQGYLNIRSLQQGIRPPAFLGDNPPHGGTPLARGASHSGRHSGARGTLVPFVTLQRTR